MIETEIDIGDAISFRQISLEDIPTITQINNLAYPLESEKGLRVTQEEIRKCLIDEEKSSTQHIPRSFLIYEGSEPVGYMLLVCRYVKGDEAPMFIRNWAMIPLRSNFEIMYQTFNHLIEQSNNGFHSYEGRARYDTSYKLLTHPRTQKMLESKGFQIIEYPRKPDYFGDEINQEEHRYIRLQKIPSLRIV